MRNYARNAETNTFNWDVEQLVETVLQAKSEAGEGRDFPQEHQPGMNGAGI